MNFFNIAKLTYHHERTKSLVNDGQLPEYLNIFSPVGRRDKNVTWVWSKRCLYVIYCL